MATRNSNKPTSAHSGSLALADQSLKLEYVAIGDIKPDPKNPRSHIDKQLKQIARSIEAAISPVSSNWRTT